MSKKFEGHCTVCPMTFTAKHREQIREMMDDHLLAHYSINADIVYKNSILERVQALADKLERGGIETVSVELLRDALNGGSDATE